MQTNTYREILQQPQMWLEEWKNMIQNRDAVTAFLKDYLTSDTEIILTGAGTSAFIGDALAPMLHQGILRKAKAVSTTDLITHASSYLCPEKPLLLISFARSGNSPESVGAINIADKLCSRIAHIFITCNEQGKLAHIAQGRKNTLLLLLPSETNDKSLAMTSSFSTMLLACILLAHINDIETQQTAVGALAQNAQTVLDNAQDGIRQIAQCPFERAVFLGSGPMKGIAEECHLKLQELTDGQVVCKFDSFLGFRHGPKAVINDKTLVVYLLSDDENVLRYEKDLIKQINSNNRLVAQIAVSCGKPVNIPGVTYDLQIVMPHTGDTAGEGICLPYVTVGQLLGFYKSLAVGLCPDTPSVSGNISRVVEGVTIYE